MKIVKKVIVAVLFSLSFIAHNQAILPSSFPELSLWLKSDLGVTLNTGLVSSWSDQSTSALTFSQSTVANRPTFVASNATINGYPTIKFDGTNDFVSGNNPIPNFGSSSISVFIVANGQSQNTSISAMLSSGLQTSGFWIFRRANQQRLATYTNNFVLQGTTQNLPTTGYDFKVFDVIKSLNNNVSLLVNSSLQINSTNSSAISTFTNGNPQIGAGNSLNFFKGEIAEIIVINKLVSESEQAGIEKYLMDKYAPPVNLGADINNSYGFCDITLAPQGGYYTNYLWSNNATTSSISINNPGTYWVEATDVFGRVSRDTIVVNRPHYSSVSLSNQLVCYNNVPTVIASMPAGDYTFLQWSDGNTNQSRQLTQGGTLNYTVKDNQNCTLTSNTATITFDNSLQNVQLGNDTTLCQGNTLQLANTSPTITSYAWNTGSTLSSIALDTSGLYILTVTNSNGCVKTDSIQITIQGQTPTISLNVPSQICENESANYSETSFVQNGDPIFSRYWDFGNGSNSSQSSGEFTNSTVGSYVGTLAVTSSIGCQSTQSFSYTVRPKPVASYTSPPLCDNVSGQFLNTSTAPSSALTSSEWLVDDVFNTNTSNLSYSHPTLGTFNLKLVVTNSFGCRDTSSQTQQVINTYPIPIVPYLVDPFNGKTVLSNEQVLFSWSSVENNYFYELQFSNSSNFSPISNTISTVQNNYTWTPNAVGTIYWRVKANNPCLLGGTSQIFSINSIQIADSLRLWLRADNGVTLNGSAVNTWLDGSSNGLNAIQNTAANQPLFISSNPILNQKPSIKFDGINDVLTGGLIPRYNTNSLSVFVIGSGGNQSTTNAVMFSSGASSTGWWFTRRASAGRIGVINNNNSLVGATTTLPTTGYDFKLFGYNKLFGTSAQIKVNGVNEISSTTAAAIGGFTNANYQVGSGNSTNYLNGEIAEIMAFTKTLTAQEQTNVEKYLMDKYARPIDLGPDIISTYGFCDITISSNGYFQSYSWSTGATTSSIQINEPGIYSVQAVDIFGRTSQDQIVVSRPVYDSISLTNQLVCFNAPQSYTAFVPNDYQFVSWSDGILTSSRILSEPTSFSYTVIDSNNCQRISNTATIIIDSSLATVSLGADTSLCIGNSISLINPPTNISSYLWNNNSTTSSVEISAQEIYWVEVTNTNNCSNRDSVSVSIIGTAPILQYSFSDTLCQFSPGSYLDNSFVPNGNGTISSNKWFISNGDTLTSSSGSISIDTSGIFNVTLLVETEEGCSSSATFPLVVHPKPVISFTTEKFCPYDAIEFTPLNTIIDPLTFTFFPLTSNFWNFDDNTTSTSPNPNHVFGTTGTYNVSLQAQDINGCRDTVVQAVYIQPQPVADFTFNNTCELSAVNFANNSNITDTFNIVTNAWTYGDGTQTTNPSFQKVYQAYGDYDVQLVVTANNGCKDTLAQTITIHPKPILGWQVGPACKNTWTTFENISTIPEGSLTETTWFINLQYEFNQQNTAFKFPTLGIQVVNLESISDQGCVSDTTFEIEVQNEISADYTVKPMNLTSGTPIQFINESLGADSSFWDFGDGNGLQINQNQINEITYDQSLNGSSIDVALIISNELGCRDTSKYTYDIKEAFLDLALQTLFVQDINGYLTVGVELSNFGSVILENADLYLKSAENGSILENWTGQLPQNQSEMYIFNAHPPSYASTQDDTERYICVEGSLINLGFVDVEVSNNIICKNIEGSGLVVLPIFPNPTEDDITVSILLTEASPLHVELVDQSGRLIVNQDYTENLDSGIHKFVLPFSNLQKGIYHLRVSDNSTTLLEKIVRY